MGEVDVYLNFISGQWKQGSSGQWDENRNPAQPSDLIGRLTRSTPKDVSDAVESAEKAQLDWARRPRPVRAQIIEKTAQVLKGRIETLAKTITREEGKNLNEARGEVQKAVNVLEFMASEGRRPTGVVIPSEMPNTFIYTTRAPLGVVGLITPWNFPICIPAWKIAPALLEGNGVVLKPSSLTPATAVMLVRAFEEAGVPAGLLNLILGSGSVVGQALVEDRRVKAISFTGSNEVGLALNVEAAKRLVRVQLEMGGKNPVIVCSDADLEQAASAILMGAFGSTGQRCTSTSRVIVEKQVHAKLVEKIIAGVRLIKVGDGLKDHTAMGPVVDAKQMEVVLAAIETAKKEGAVLLCGGERVAVSEPSGYFIAPTVFDNVKSTMHLARQEVFGPVLAVIPVNDYEEAIEVANDVEYGLSSSVYTNNVVKVMQYCDRLETGMLHVNSPTVGGETQAPFGGMKMTGIGGREMGSMGPEFFCEMKTVYIDTNASVRKGNLY